jgi:hypothetical protein|tara:strand:- start:640 stop:978 length:339 start_codon:yes stop_codon:yes gene_type:complete
MGTRGQPKISYFIEQCIAFKVMQYAKRYNESHYKAWFRLTKHRAFKDLMNVNYKNRRAREYWVQRLTTDPKAYEYKRKFYSRHVKKWVNMRSGIGSLKDWTIRYKLIKAPGQ